MLRPTRTSSSEILFPHFGRLAVLLLLLGSVIGCSLLLLGAPLWAYYLAPILGLPVLFRALAMIDTAPISATELDRQLAMADWKRSPNRMASLMKLVAILATLAILGSLITVAVSSMREGSGSPAAPAIKRESPPKSSNVKTPPGSVASSKEESASSSPLVPILIATAALAAISIGIVVIRQRRLRTRHNAEPHGRLL